MGMFNIDDPKAVKELEELHKIEMTEFAEIRKRHVCMGMDNKEENILNKKSVYGFNEFIKKYKPTPKEIIDVNRLNERIRDTSYRVCDLDISDELLTAEQLEAHTEKMIWEDMNTVFEYMTRKDLVVAATNQVIYDVIAKKETPIPILAYSDGEFNWDGRFFYFLRFYDLRLKPDFISKALNWKSDQAR